MYAASSLATPIGIVFAWALHWTTLSLPLLRSIKSTPPSPVAGVNWAWYPIAEERDGLPETSLR